MTDFYWSLKVGLPSIERDPKRYQQDKNAVVWEWKKDWYDLDFRYLRDHPDFKAYKIYTSAVGFENRFLDFFARDAFELARQRITAFYSERRENLDREYPWLTPKKADEFVEDVTKMISREMEKYI